MAGLIAASPACASSGLIGGARTVGEGHTELFVAPQMSIGGSDAIGTTAAQLTLGVRHGLTDRVDLGARLWAFPTSFVSMVGGSVDVKVAVLRSRRTNRGVDLALLPSAGYQFVEGRGTDVHVVFGHLPFAVGINVGGDNQVVIAPGVSYQLSLSRGAAPVHFPFITGAAGFMWTIDDDWWLMPEVGVMWSWVGTADGPGTAIIRGGVGAGFDLWGADNSRDL